MAAKKRCVLPGEFRSLELARGTWRLERGGPEPAEVFVRGVQPMAAALLGTVALGDLDIEWSETATSLCATLDGQRSTLPVRSAIVHQPLPGLYRGLPLAVLDDTTRRFWRRVFLVARWPGGRFLLAWLARNGSRRRGGT
ncbi:MAG TPA: hypothetical protein VHZ53_04225 [Steroidobacteraceae bacterium]|jgi:hypothetical protein|nr:hypothetical protein [Steroidobacteraceae bacterium]